MQNYLLMVRDPDFVGGRMGHKKFRNSNGAIGWAVEESRRQTFREWTLFLYDSKDLAPGADGLLEVATEDVLMRTSA
ncbi:hypothetical protein BH09ACT10_BH09ACT10_26070 [soil metagenome]